MNKTVGVLMLWLAFASASCAAAQQATAPAASTAELGPEEKAILLRLTSEKNRDMLLGACWTVCHCATEAGKARAERVFSVLGDTLEGSAPALAAIGGAKGFRKALQKTLGDPDPVMRGFAAMNLAVIGDEESKGKIAALLGKPEKREPLQSPDAFRGFDRSRAAIGLGLMGAREYGEKVAALLGACRSLEVERATPRAL
jgi:hypothetical protein